MARTGTCPHCADTDLPVHGGLLAPHNTLHRDRHGIHTARPCTGTRPIPEPAPVGVRPLSRRQWNVLRHIADVTHGRPPTLRQIAAAVGDPHRHNTCRTVAQLAQRGLLVRWDGERPLTVTAAGRAVAAGWQRCDTGGRVEYVLWRACPPVGWWPGLVGALRESGRCWPGLVVDDVRVLVVVAGVAA